MLDVEIVSLQFWLHDITWISKCKRARNSLAEGAGQIVNCSEWPTQLNWRELTDQLWANHGEGSEGKAPNESTYANEPNVVSNECDAHTND